jgi:hypothetical protein
MQVRAGRRWRELTAALVVIAVLAGGLTRLSWLVTHPGHTHQVPHVAAKR